MKWGEKSWEKKRLLIKGGEQEREKERVAGGGWERKSRFIVIRHQYCLRVYQIYQFRQKYNKVIVHLFFFFFIFQFIVRWQDHVVLQNIIVFNDISNQFVSFNLLSIVHLFLVGMYHVWIVFVLWYTTVQCSKKRTRVEPSSVDIINSLYNIRIRYNQKTS